MSWHNLVSIPLPHYGMPYLATPSSANSPVIEHIWNTHCFAWRKQAIQEILGVQDNANIFAELSFSCLPWSIKNALQSRQKDGTLSAIGNHVSDKYLEIDRRK